MSDKREQNGRYPSHLIESSLALFVVDVLRMNAILMTMNYFNQGRSISFVRLKVFGLFVGSFILSACSLDEDVIERCAKKHPDSWRGRALCEHRVGKEVAAERREEKAAECVLEESMRIEANLSWLKEHLSQNACTEWKSLENVVTQKFQISADKSLFTEVDAKTKNAFYSDMVLVATLKTNCNSAKAYLTNVRLSKDGFPLYLRVWNNGPPGAPKVEFYLRDFEWTRPSDSTKTEFYCKSKSHLKP